MLSFLLLRYFLLLLHVQVEKILLLKILTEILLFQDISHVFSAVAVVVIQAEVRIQVKIIVKKMKLKKMKLRILFKERDGNLQTENQN